VSVAKMTLITLAKSKVDFAKAPMPSKSGLPGWVPERSTVPWVALRAYNAARPAGCTTDPIDSRPNEMGAKPAATATALPDEDPDGVYAFQNRRGGGGLRTYSHCVLKRCHLPIHRRGRMEIASCTQVNQAPFA
jgi:hypothetical protein